MENHLTKTQSTKAYHRQTLPKNCHEVLGHIWGEMLGGAPSGTRANMRDSPAFQQIKNAAQARRTVAVESENLSRYSAERVRMSPLIPLFLQLSSKVSKPMDSPMSASANAIFIRVQGTFSDARASLIAGIVSTALSSASLFAAKSLTSGSVFLRASTKADCVD